MINDYIPGNVLRTLYVFVNSFIRNYESGYYYYECFSDEKSKAHCSKFLLKFIKIGNTELL